MTLFRDKLPHLDHFYKSARYPFHTPISRKQHNWHALLKTVETVINNPFGAFNVLSPIAAKEQLQQKLYFS
jgi:hypothetical protein